MKKENFLNRFVIVIQFYLFSKMERPISLLRLPGTVRSQLQSFGFFSIEDIENASANLDLFSSLKELFEVYKIFEKIQNLNNIPTIESAADMLQQSKVPIAIFHEGINNLLDGGLPVGQVTELCGPPGCGKTQMCLQFSIDVQVPKELGGSAGEAFYVTTDFGFHVDRLQEIAQGTIDHFIETKGLSMNIQNKFTLESLLSGVKVLKLYDVKHILEMTSILKNFFERHPNIKLLIIDSFSMPFILDVEDTNLRTKILSVFLNSVVELSVKFEFAIVLTNQVMTIVHGEDKSIIRPSLGQAYAHRIHQRLIIKDNKVFLSKSVIQPQIFSYFDITRNGIR